LFSASLLGRICLAAATAVLAACGGGDASARPPADAASASVPSPGVQGTAVQATDDAGQVVRLERPAARIVSLIPSATDLLVAMGARGQLAGRTDFDTDPALASLPSVGGGLDPSLEALAALRPDLVISFETQGDATLRTRLRDLGIPVYGLAAQDTADVFRALANLGVLAGRRAEADGVAAAVRGELEAVRRSVAGRPAPSVVYVAWVEPPMIAGPSTFLSELVRVAGGRPVFDDVKQEWPQVSVEEIVSRKPQVIVIPAGAGAEFSAASLRAAPGWRELTAQPGTRVAEVPVAVVNRPGPRLGEAARALRDALHPELAADPERAAP
jgi:iron complex transport system substrate-binding protein